ncbi:MAG: hypothetical protein AAFW95_14975 [Cyanobacteria bacterium J06638_6]
MKLLFGSSILLVGLVACASGETESGPLTGTVERVWEDGFEINTGDRTVKVDAWDVCGDNTQQSASVGDQLTVEGSFSGREFDASAITDANGESICS